MDLVYIILLAVSLSVDSMIVAMASGAIIGNHKPLNVLKIAGMLGFVQMGFTILGWLVGSSVAHYIYQCDHWLAFFVLFALGCKILYEAFKSEEERKVFDPLNVRILFSLSVATSIDAVAVGLSFSLLNGAIGSLAIVVGFVTFVASACAVFFGSKIGRRFNSKLNIIGAGILILIGLNILWEHLGGI